MIVTGNGGCIQIKRSSGELLKTEVSEADINEALKRVGFAGAESNILTGDRVEIFTNDPRGLLFVPPEWWADGVVHNSVSFYAHVNAMGGLRIYRDFVDAINNNQSKASPVKAFDGEPLSINVQVKDTALRPLGGVAGYTFNTDRAAVDVTSLGDLFTHQYSAGTISGSGTFDCYFQINGGMCAVAGGEDQELSMVLPQLLFRADMGGEFDAILTIASPTPETPIYYEVRGIVTRSAVTVRPSSIIELAVDFVTTGEFGLKIGEPSGYILMEDYYRMMREQDVDSLLSEPDD